ncbi:MAG: aminotransferase class I/II-fold pyridoxal phosphate-dependent enzyme [Lachnospiraceae bacterium]|nr:aminotransferase class I/II-fold pyridoxal phosphate-dependent enzyme [Lachnospiraceae bacterium]
MYSFNNDYSEGAHPRILQAMMETNLIQNDGYSLDRHTNHAKELIRHEIQREDVDVHILVGGTQTNLLGICCALRPHQAVICAETGHINVHETGAIEATGHKVLGQPTTDGKLTTAHIQKALDWHSDEHMVQPKMVYISNSTEVGTQYTKAELETISAFCRQHQLYLFMDGARMGAALTSSVNDLTLADIARLTDLFYIGGTKNGALFGETMIISHPDLKTDFRYIIKQHGAMLAKGWLLGIQFEELFQNHLFYDLAAHANEMADQLRRGITECGYSFHWNSMTNQLFPVLPNSVLEALAKDFLFSTQLVIDERHTCIRLVTSWATRQDGVDAFLAALKKLS